MPLVVLLVLLSMSASAADPYADGMKALEAQKYDEAAQLFLKAVEADPKDYASHFHLALSNSLLGRDAEAAAGYRKVLELKPGLYEAELNLGIVLLRQKQYAEAVPYLEAAAGKKPKEFRPVFHLAEAFYGSGKFPEADAQYKAAAGIDEKSAAVHAGWARTLVKLNRLDDAAPHYQKAADLDPAYRDLLLELAARYEEQKQPAGAIAIYEKFPENPGARERLGGLLLESGKTADAIPQLEAAFKSSPTPGNRLALATAYIRSKQLDKAVPLLAQGVAEEPNQMELRMIYGRALRDQRNYTAAANEFFKVAQAKPDSREAWSELAAVLILTDNYPQALAVFDRLKQLGVETAANHYFRAIILDKMKQYKPAWESYDKFLSMSEGKHPDEEFKARQRIKVIQKELSKR